MILLILHRLFIFCHFFLLPLVNLLFYHFLLSFKVFNLCLFEDLFTPLLFGLQFALLLILFHSDMVILDLFPHSMLFLKCFFQLKQLIFQIFREGLNGFSLRIWTVKIIVYGSFFNRFPCLGLFYFLCRVFNLSFAYYFGLLM